MRIIILCALALRLASACHGPDVTISGTAGDNQSKFQDVDGSNFNSLEAKYGDDVTISCTGTNSKDLNIKLEGTGRKESVELTQIVSNTTIKLTTKKPNIDLFYRYTCIDVITNCTATLSVGVIPAITVVSANVRYKRTENKVTYFVPIEEDYEVICSGNAELTMDKTTNDIETIQLNEDTIVTNKENERTASFFYYTCKHEPEFGRASIDVAIDHPPAAKNFWCVQDDLQINCYWDSLSDYATFTIYYLDPDQKSMRIYEDHIVNKKNRSSEWSLTEIWHNGLTLRQNITFVMQSCNYIYCSNETYNINRNHIKKTKSPADLKLLEVSSQTALLTWKELDKAFLNMQALNYKLTYKLPGMLQRELNSSSLQVTCMNEFRAGLGYFTNCKGKVKLPCPGKYYEIKVYSKSKDTPNRKEYWSKPASINIQTLPVNSTSSDPVCEDPNIDEIRNELKSIERKVDFIWKVCQEEKLDICNILSTICFSNKNLEDLGSGWLYGKEWLRLFYLALRHHHLEKLYEGGEEDNIREGIWEKNVEVAKKLSKL